jgi:hypothetical protein
MGKKSDDRILQEHYNGTNSNPTKILNHESKCITKRGYE